MAKSPDDIYKEDKIPLFARKGYRSRRSRREKGGASSEGSSSERRATLYGQRERRPSIDEDEFILLQGTGSSKRKGSRSRSRLKARLIRQIGIILGVVALVYALILVAILGARMHTSNKARKQDKAKAVVEAQHKEEKQAEVEALRKLSRLDDLNEQIGMLDRSTRALKTVRAPGRGTSSEEKIKLLEMAENETPNYFAVKLALAEHCIEHQEYERAIDLLMKALRIEPTNQEVRTKLGKALIKSKDYLAAERIGHWILSELPYSLDGHSILAGAYLNLDRLELAIKHLHKVVEYDPRNVVAQNNLGVAYSRMKNYPQAIKIFANILKQDEVNTISYYNLAFCYAQTKDAAKAADVIEQAATHFGYAFVMSWLERPDFESIRHSMEFRKLAERIEEYAATDSTLQMNTLEPIVPSQPSQEAVVAEPSERPRPTALKGLNVIP